MAYLPNQDQQTQSQGGIPTLQGSGGPSVSAGSGRPGPAASPGAAPSTPWSNISNYLTANAGQAGKVADTLAGNLTNQYNTANQQIGQTAQNYGQQIESNRVPLDQSLAQKAASTPSQLVQNPNDVAAFQKMYNAQYKGPKDFSTSDDYSKLASGVEKAQKNAALVNQGTPGIQTLLQQAESAQGRNPTQGITALDTLLLQEAPENFGKIAEAAKPFSGLTDYLGSTQKGLDTAAQNAAKEAAQTQATLQNQFMGPGGVIPSWQNRENQQLQDLSKQGTAYNTEIASIIQKLNNAEPLTNDEISKLNIANGPLESGAPNDTNWLIGPDGIFPQIVNSGVIPAGRGFLSQYYSPNDQIAQPTMANVSSAQEYADAQALNQLLGQDTGLAYAPEQYNIPSQYGTFAPGSAINELLQDFYRSDDRQLTPQQSALWNQFHEHIFGPTVATNPAPPPPIDQGTPIPVFPNQQNPQGNPVVSGGGRAFR